jgi:ABC-type transport system involved in multi-copper enzyme maturation permease subunit
MNALASVRAVGAQSVGGPTLVGARPFFRKELRDWIRSWRAVSLFVVTTPLMVISTLGPKIGETAARSNGEPIPTDLSFDATTNILGLWPQWIWMFVIFASFSLLIAERDRGTLAWSLSKPLSRTGLLVAKWAAAVIMFTVFGIVLPMVACVIAAMLAYGMPDMGTVVVGTLLLTATPVFFIALTLALSTVLPSQAGVAGVAVGVALAPALLAPIFPAVVEWLPSSISLWAVNTTLGQPLSLSTPIAFVVFTVAVAVIGITRLRTVDL